MGAAGEGAVRREDAMIEPHKAGFARNPGDELPSVECRAAAYRDQAADGRAGSRYGTSCHSTGALDFLFFVAVVNG